MLFPNTGANVVSGKLLMLLGGVTLNGLLDLNQLVYCYLAEDVH